MKLWKNHLFYQMIQFSKRAKWYKQDHFRDQIYLHKKVKIRLYLIYNWKKYLLIKIENNVGVYIKQWSISANPNKNYQLKVL